MQLKREKETPNLTGDEKLENRFNESLKGLNPYFCKLSSKYEMEPHISADDIYQICLEQLSKMVEGTELDIKSNSFAALAKTLAKNAVVDEMRRYQTQSRDRSKEVREMKSSEGEVLSIFNFIGDSRPENNPEEMAIYNDMVEKMTRNLNSQERQLFNELTDPCSKSWDLLDIQVDSGKSWTKPTYGMIAESMNMTVAKMRYLLYKLRDKIMESLISCPTCGGDEVKKELIKDDDWLYGCDNIQCSNNGLFIPCVSV